MKNITQSITALIKKMKIKIRYYQIPMDSPHRIWINDICYLNPRLENKKIIKDLACRLDYYELCIIGSLAFHAREYANKSCMYADLTVFLTLNDYLHQIIKKDKLDSCIADPISHIDSNEYTRDALLFYICNSSLWTSLK